MLELSSISILPSLFFFWVASFSRVLHLSDINTFLFSSFQRAFFSKCIDIYYINKYYCKIEYLSLAATMKPARPTTAPVENEEEDGLERGDEENLEGESGGYSF